MDHLPIILILLVSTLYNQSHFPRVLIAFRADLTFADFLRWATPISIIGLAIAIPILLKYFSKEIKQLGTAMTAQSTGNGSQRVSHSSTTVVEQIVGAPKKQSRYLIPWILFIATIGV
jgi:Na+/H+ antiporter NhaD/arsenite permease-like protein